MDWDSDDTIAEASSWLDLKNADEGCPDDVRRQAGDDLIDTMLAHGEAA